MATDLLPVPVTALVVSRCGSDLDKVWGRMSEGRGQVRNWTGQWFSPWVLGQLCLSYGLLSGLTEWWDSVTKESPQQAGDGHGYDAGRELDIAEAEACLRGKSCNSSSSFPLRVETRGFIGSNH